ncbi:hypothetical protein P3339_05005 [Microbulbifer sp. MLAF003]|uniref:hypothetical protein n=1 Tax=Microbulbifer sp. MLAF003 TaxID=3032582 RepID=UPI0024ADB65E|nr:hypothetical protein [Microbulbifer sp. MLAF003]WHI52167.1 hypothetical protein P3339_05005 [Microbulbifer sp. MLAF003]
MKADYSQSENKKLDGEKYFQVCAEVLNSPMVMKEIGELKQTNDFRVSVANPDSGKNIFNVCSFF